MQRRRYARHQVVRAAEHGPHHVPFTDVLRERTAGAEWQNIVPPVDDGNRHRLGLVLLHMPAPTLTGHQELGDLVAVDDLAPVATDVVASGHLVLSDHTTERVDVAAAVTAVPLWDRKLP